ncbi:MAG: copper amine oxidase N-terminal domain-containing protein, partial [Firmicutes bacterium]|nr:copper amine oxidase N-terminal domain-containing protein [Bacillota bacterium]
MKRICVIGVLSVLLSLLLCASVLASAETFAGFPVVKLMVNGQLKEPTSPVIIIDGRTYVPLRFVSESLGAKVDWDDVTGTVKIITSGLVPQSSPVQPVGQTSPLSATDKGIT